jgi:hypothetical protein
MNSEDIRRLIGEGEYEFTFHAQQERLADNLDITQIENAIMAGEIIEQYPDDPRGESCLVAGHTGTKPIHAVLGWATNRSSGEKILRVITVYVPQPPKWKDYRTRGDRP